MKNKNKPLIMGILNVTPDSFSDGGNFNQIDQAIKQVDKIIKEGAQIIDVGGESTRPGADFIDANTEIKRVIPIIKAIKNQFDIAISIDTYKSEVAKAAIEAGAEYINDVWSNQYDGKMIDLICQYQVNYIWMHNQKTSNYNDLVTDIKSQFNDFYQELSQRNYPLEKLYFDPGIGFAKTPKQNLELIKRIHEFNDLEVPILLGTSRKSVYKYALGIDQAVERDSVTAQTSFYATLNDVAVIRVHNVQLNAQAVEHAWQLMGATHESN